MSRAWFQILPERAENGVQNGCNYGKLAKPLHFLPCASSVLEYIDGDFRGGVSGTLADRATGRESSFFAKNAGICANQQTTKPQAFGDSLVTAVSKCGGGENRLELLGVLGRVVAIRVANEASTTMTVGIGPNHLRRETLHLLFRTTSAEEPSLRIPVVIKPRHEVVVKPEAIRFGATTRKALLTRSTAVVNLAGSALERLELVGIDSPAYLKCREKASSNQIVKMWCSILSMP